MGSGFIEGCVVWDNHACMPLRPGDVRFLPQLQRVHDAGVDVITLNIACGRQDSQSALSMLSTFHHWIEERSSQYLIVASADDIETAKKSRRLGICFDIEGMDALDGDLRYVQAFYDLGVRWMLGAYNLPNGAGGGCL